MPKLHHALALVLVGCASTPAPGTTPESASVVGRIQYVDSATFDSIQRATPPTDSAALAFSRRFDSLAVLVDTIVILSPDSIVLHVGETVDHHSLIQQEGRRASGEVLSTYPGFWDIEDRSVATFTAAGIQGLQPGRTRIVLTVMTRTAHAPPSYVPVVVIP